jgi:hypothetical protein
MEIELSVKISEEDFVKINREIYKKSKKTIVQRFFLIVFWIFIIGSSFLSVLSLLDGSFLDNLTLNIYPIIMVLIFIFGIPQLRIYNYRKFFKKNKSILETLHYNIDNEFINLKTRLSESKSSWDAIVQVQEISDWFLLRTNTVSFLPLSKNQLNQSQQVWLRDKITKN